MLVALAIGAPTPGCVLVQESATVAIVAPVSADTDSSAASTALPFGLPIYSMLRAPRTDWQCRLWIGTYPSKTRWRGCNMKETQATRRHDVLQFGLIFFAFQEIIPTLHCNCGVQALGMGDG